MNAQSHILDFLSADVRWWVEETARLEHVDPVTIIRQIVRERAEYDAERKDSAV